VKGPPSSSSRDKVTKKRRGKERVEWGRGLWRAVLALMPRAPEFQVTSLRVHGRSRLQDCSDRVGLLTRVSEIITVEHLQSCMQRHID